MSKKKILLFITEILIGSASTISFSMMNLITLGNIISSSTALLTSIAFLITNEYLSKFKRSSTKLRDWINIIILSYEKNLKTSMVDKKIDEKEAEELKKVYNHYLDKRKDIMKKTQFKVEDVFGDIKSRDKFSEEQITKMKKFSTKVL